MGFTDVKKYVCLSLLEFCPPGINPEFVMECMHIQYHKCTRRNCPELSHCPGVKDQWDCVLNDLEELGQYSIEIFYCCLRLLPFCSSTFHRTNAESSQNRSEDKLLISRIQSPNLLLVCHKPSPVSNTLSVVRTEAYKNKTAWAAIYMAGTLNVTNMICAMRSRLPLAFRRAKRDVFQAQP